MWQAAMAVRFPQGLPPDCYDVFARRYSAMLAARPAAPVEGGSLDCDALYEDVAKRYPIILSRLAESEASDAAPVPAEGAEPRFFIDHGLIHDRVTGRHVTTAPDDETYWGGTITGACELLNSLSVVAPTQPEAGGEVEALKAIAACYSTLSDDALEAGILFEFGPPKPRVGAALLKVRRALDAHRSAQGTVDE